jgi:hypothetical protein
MDNANASASPTMSFSGWLPNGMKVYFTMPSDFENAMEMAITFTDKLIAKGFRQHEPGLEEGEQRETINMVARRNKLNDDGSNTPVLDLYVNNDKMKHRFIAVYLNTPEDVQAFESVSGIKLTSIPLNPTKAPVDRDVKEFTLATKPFNIVYKNNPQYDETNDSKKPKRLFVRFDGIQASLTPTNGESGLNANVESNNGTLGADWNPETVKQFVTSYQGKLDTDQLLGALQVTRFGEWKQGKAAAYVAADAALKIAQVDF